MRRLPALNHSWSCITVCKHITFEFTEQARKDVPYVQLKKFNQAGMRILLRVLQE